MLYLWHWFCVAHVLCGMYCLLVHLNTVALSWGLTITVVVIISLSFFEFQSILLYRGISGTRGKFLLLLQTELRV